MPKPVIIPRKAADQVAALIQQYQAAEATLRSHVALLASALDVPDGWQLQPQPDGTMAFMPLGGIESPKETAVN